MGNKLNEYRQSMGSSQSHRVINEPFRFEQWQLTAQQPNFSVYRHRQSSQEVQIYHPSQIPAQEIPFYELRKQQPHAQLPRLLHYIHNNPNRQPPYLILQRTPTRLSHLQSIPFKPPLNVLLQVLEGCQVLYSRFGAVKITAEMVGFTKEGATKVWVNRDFSSSRPEGKLESEQIMVQNIFGLFEPYLKENTAHRKNFMSFNEAITYVKDKASRKVLVDMSVQRLQPSPTGKQPLLHQRSTVKYMGVASPNLRSTGMPVSCVVMRGAPKTVQLDVTDQRNNISSNSNKVGESPPARVDFRKPASFTYSNNPQQAQQNSRPISTLNQTPPIVKSPQLATQPRHAINQLSNLHQSHQAVETNSRIYSPIVQGNFAEAARKVSSSVTPVFRHAIMGDHSKNMSNPLNPTKQVPNTTNTSSLSPNSNRVVREVMRVTQLGGHGSPVQEEKKVQVMNTVGSQIKYFPKKQQKVHFSFESAPEKRVQRIQTLPTNPILRKKQQPQIPQPRRVIQSVTLPSQNKNTPLRQTRPQLINSYRIMEFPRTTINLPIKQQISQQIPQPFINRNISYRPRTRETHEKKASGGKDEDRETEKGEELTVEEKNGEDAVAKPSMETTNSTNPPIYYEQVLLPIKYTNPQPTKTIYQQQIPIIQQKPQTPQPSQQRDIAPPIKQQKIQPVVILHHPQPSIPPPKLHNVVLSPQIPNSSVQTQTNLVYLPIQSSIGIQKSQQDNLLSTVTVLHDIQEVLTDQTKRENTKDKGFEETNTHQVLSQRYGVFEPSTTTKRHNTDKKQANYLQTNKNSKHSSAQRAPPSDKKYKESFMLNSQQNNTQKVEVQYQKTTPQLVFIKPKKKVIVGHLRDNPIDSVLPQTHEIVGAHIHPTPAQRFNQIIIQPQSDHSIPSPQTELAHDQQQKQDQEEIPDVPGIYIQNASVKEQPPKQILVIPSNNIREEAAAILADSVYLTSNYDPQQKQYYQEQEQSQDQQYQQYQQAQQYNQYQEYQQPQAQAEAYIPVPTWTRRQPHYPYPNPQPRSHNSPSPYPYYPPSARDSVRQILANERMKRQQKRDNSFQELQRQRQESYRRRMIERQREEEAKQREVQYRRRLWEQQEEERMRREQQQQDRYIQEHAAYQNAYHDEHQQQHYEQHEYRSHRQQPEQEQSQKPSQKEQQGGFYAQVLKQQEDSIEQRRKLTQDVLRRQTLEASKLLQSQYCQSELSQQYNPSRHQSYQPLYKSQYHKQQLVNHAPSNVPEVDNENYVSQLERFIEQHKVSEHKDTNSQAAIPIPDVSAGRKRITKEISFGNYPGSADHVEQSQPITYEAIHNQFQSMLKSSRKHFPQTTESRRSSKEKTIEQKIQYKRHKFKPLKDEAKRVLES